jgi:hypothetical protein
MLDIRLPRAGALALLLTVAGAAGAGPAAAASKAEQAPKAPVQRAVATCLDPGDDLEFGGAQVRLRFASGRLAADDSYVLVPVDDATGADAGERTTVQRRQRTATVVVPADGTTLTRATTVEVRLGGDVLQRIPVSPGCGVVDPAPDRGPVLGAITSDAGTVTVAVENGSRTADEIGLTLFPVGENTGESRFVTLAPGATGTVTFAGVTPGSYVVEAFGYTTFRSSSSVPFPVG